MTKHFHYEELESTNDKAVELLEKFPTVAVSADFQTLGRGRHGKSWIGEPNKNLYFSYAFLHKTNPDYRRLILLQALGAIAVKRVLHEITDENCFYIKYPNDVYTVRSDSKNKYYGKIAGVMTEQGFQGNICKHTVIGIGINCLQTNYNNHLEVNPVSLSMFGFDIYPLSIVPPMIYIIEELMQISDDELFELWKSELNIINKKIIIINRKDCDKCIWKVVEMMTDGRLQLEHIDTKERIFIDEGDSIRYDLTK